MERKVIDANDIVSIGNKLIRSYFFFSPTLKSGKSNDNDWLKAKLFFAIYIIPTDSLKYVLLNSLDCARLDNYTENKVKGVKG
jgi:hypothetical protein